MATQCQSCGAGHAGGAARGRKRRVHPRGTIVAIDVEPEARVQTGHCCMGLEGGVKLAYRKELLAIADPAQRQAWFDDMVAKEHEKNKALSSATYLEVDDVIDPADTRRWLVRGLRSLPAPVPRARKKRASVDVW